MSASVDIIHLEKTLLPLFHEINMDCKCNWTKYVFDSLMRKIILGGIVSCNVTADWAGTTLPELRRMVADQAEYISAFPDTYTVCMASDMIWGRRDRGLFLTMFGCLFHEVQTLWPDKEG